MMELYFNIVDTTCDNCHDSVSCVEIGYCPKESVYLCLQCIDAIGSKLDDYLEAKDAAKDQETGT